MLEDVGTTVDLTALLPLILEILAGLVLAMAAWAIKKYATKLGIDADAETRAYLLTAVVAAVTYGRNKALEELGTADWTKVDVRNALLAHGVAYVLQRVPDAVSRFNLKEQDIRELIIARLEN